MPKLLLLQQILFFRELGFNLKDIQKLLLQDDFDKVKALQAHKHVLTEDISRKNKLITTIDKTISHLRGKETMQDEELYYGFDKKIPKSGKYIIKCAGIPSEKILEQFKKDEVEWSEQQWKDFKNQVDNIDKAIARFIEQGLGYDCDKVQKLIHEHYTLQENFFDLTKEAYTALIEMYEAKNPEMRKFFHVYHPKMQAFMCKAMRLYAEKNL